MTGAGAGDASGAGIRFSRLGIRGAGEPRRRVGSRAMAPRPAPWPWPPPRAKPGADATTQAIANTATKTRMIAFLLFCLRPPRNLIIQQGIALLSLPGLDRSCCLRPATVRGTGERSGNAVRAGRSSCPICGSPAPVAPTATRGESVQWGQRNAWGSTVNKDDFLKSLLAYGHVSSGRFTTIGVEVLLTTTQ
jgi:hypothetical protein